LFEIDILESKIRQYNLRNPANLYSTLGDLSLIHGKALNESMLQKITLAIKQCPGKDIVIPYSIALLAAAATNGAVFDAYHSISSNPASFHSRNSGYDKSSSRNEKLRMLRELPSRAINLLYNSANFYFLGKCVHQYAKQTDWMENQDAKMPNVAVTGSAVPIVNIGGLSIGVEICFDHANGILRQHIQNNQAKSIYLLNPADHMQRELVDVHLILSAYTHNQSIYFCHKNGGYLMHSSSDAASSCCIAKGAPAPIDLSSIRSRVCPEIAYRTRSIQVVFSQDQKQHDHIDTNSYRI